MKKRILTLVSILFAVLVYSQSISGIVYNKKGVAVSGIEVKLKPINKSVSTKDNGYYKFDVEKGNYVLEVYKRGVIVDYQEVSITDSGSKTIDFNLDKIIELEDLKLFGSVNKRPDKLDQITRLPLKSTENIQSITTISSKVIEEQGVLTISGAVKNAPGLYTYATYGDTRESIGSRGYRGVPLLKNGVRVHSDFRGSGFLTDMQGIESVQVLKGANAITQGFGTDLGAAGGVVNLVTKTPKMGNFGKVSLRYGSWNSIRPTIDINRVFTEKKNVAFRINGAYEHSDGYRDNNSKNRYYINPSFSWKPIDKLEIVLEMDYLDDNRTPDPGTINLSKDNTKNEIYDLPKNKYLGFKDNFSDTKNLTYAARAKYDIDNNFYLRAGYFASNLDTDGEFTYLRQFKKKGEDIKHPNMVARQISRYPYREDNNQVFQLDFVGKELKSGNFKSLFQVGVDYKSFNAVSKSFKGAIIDTINVYSSNISNQLPSKHKFKNTGISDSKSYEYGLLGQYVLEYKDFARLFLGGRFSKFNSESTSSRYDPKTKEFKVRESKKDGSGWNPLFGFMINPTKNIGVFASFTTILDPRSADKVDKNGKQLGNETSQQIELGVKSEWFAKKLRFNATYYNTQNNNMIMRDVTTDSSGALEYLPYYFKGGNDTRQGIELELIGQILHNWEIMAGYSYLKATYNKSTRFVDGSSPNNTPKSVANLWTNYTIDRGLLKGTSFGASMYYLGERPYNDHVFMAFHGIEVGLAPWNNKAYTTVNAHLGYERENYEIRAYFNNMFDNIGYNAYRNRFINRIDPRNIAVKLSYKF